MEGLCSWIINAGMLKMIKNDTIEQLHINWLALSQFYKNHASYDLVFFFPLLYKKQKGVKQKQCLIMPLEPQ